MESAKVVQKWNVKIISVSTVRCSHFLLTNYQKCCFRDVLKQVCCQFIETLLICLLQLSKHKRHQDRTAVLEFWDRLDAFLRSRKSNLIC